MFQIKNLERLISRLEERVKTRESNIEVMVNRLETYFTVYTTTIKTLQTVMKEAESFEVIGGDVETIRSQKQTFKVC